MPPNSMPSRPGSSEETNALPTVTDQTVGDLNAFIKQLVPLCPSHAASMPVSSILDYLKKTAPTVFSELDRLSEMARVVSGLNEEVATQWKIKGNKEFVAQHFDQSVSTYTQGLLCAREDETVATLLNNRSTALFQLQNYAGACLDANRALMYKPDYWKALQRRGRALDELGLHDLARRDLDAAAAESVQQANDADTMHNIFVQAALLPRKTRQKNSNDISTIVNVTDSNRQTDRPEIDTQSNYIDACDADEPRAILSSAASLRVQCRGPEHPYGDFARSLVANKSITIPTGAGRTSNTSTHDSETNELHDSVICETPYAMIARAEALLSVCAHCLRATMCLYHGDDYRAAGYKSRGLFCSEECAHASWCRDGVVESQHVFHLCCPNDALLACRMVRAEKEGRVVSLIGGEGRAFAAAAMNCRIYSANADAKSSDGRADTHNKEATLAQLGSDFVHTLRSNLSRELESVSVLRLPSTSPTPKTNAAESREHQQAATIGSNNDTPNDGQAENDTRRSGSTAVHPAGPATPNSSPHNQSETGIDAIAMTSGGCESVVTALGLYMGAYDADTAEHIRTAHRVILCNAIDLTYTLRSALPPTTKTSPSKHSLAVMHKDTVVTAGKGLYVVAALLNHSCDPNCFLSVLHNPQGCSHHVVVRAIRSIAAGEELTIAYGGVTKFRLHSASLRTRTLSEKYGFVCQCRVCLSEFGGTSNGLEGGLSNREPAMTPAMRAHYIRAADMYHKGSRLLRERNYATAVTVLLQSYEMVMRFICPPPRPPQPMLLKVHNALARAYSHLQQREKCYEHLRAELEIAMAIHATDNQPEMIHAYMRLAAVAPDSARRMEYAERAVDLLRHYYAPSPLRELQVLHIFSCAREAASTGK